MPTWAIWIAIAAVLGAGEIATAGFILGPVGLAALVAALPAGIGAATWLQIVVFTVASAASLAFLRPVARAHSQTPARLRTGAAALVGAPAVVVQRVDGNGGQVKIGGELWTARSYDEDRVIEPGQRVQVVQIDGATALVM